MPIYAFSCPICKKRYKLTLNNPAALVHKDFTCPQCKYTAPFTNIIKDLGTHQQVVSPQVQPPPYPGPGMHSKTRVSGQAGKQPVASLTVLGSNANFILKQGVYILGRKSSDSTATLQLAPDISMSRQHARLAVQMVGGRLMVQVVGLKDNNPLFVNGKMYPAGQPCTLKTGDTLQLGTTKIVLAI